MINKDRLKRALEERDSSFFLQESEVDIMNLWLPERFVQDYNEHLYHTAIRLSMTPLVRQIIGNPRAGQLVLFHIKNGIGLTALQVAARHSDKLTFSYVYGTYSNRDMVVDTRDLIDNVMLSNNRELIDHILDNYHFPGYLPPKSLKIKDTSPDVLKALVEKDHIEIFKQMVDYMSDLKIEIEPDLTLLEFIQKQSGASSVRQYLTNLGMRLAKKRTNIVI